MKVGNITKPVSSLHGVGPAVARNLARLNILSVADLLTHYPKDWEDRTKRVPLKDFVTTAKVHTLAQVCEHNWFGYGAMRTLKITIDDGTATAELVCFRRPFLEKSCPIGSIIRVTGSFSVKYATVQSTAFEVELVCADGSIEAFLNAQIPDSGVLPVYVLTANITQSFLRKIIALALREYGKGIENELPQPVIERNNLMTKQTALFAIHRPQTVEEVSRARYTLIFEELFNFQTTLGQRSLERRGQLPLDSKPSVEKTPPADEVFLKAMSPRQKQLVERLPFALTPDQKITVLEMNADIDAGFGKTAKKTYAMARLLQGDVGSGKTLVAFLLCLRVVDWGGQCALLAPTELLSRQHAENAATLLDGIASLAFLTGNVKAAGRKNLLAELKSGNINIVIGTHTLFSQSVEYKNLSLAVIDEQHRFGVLQRGAILAKGKPNTPHLLLMSATPIPQTLELTLYGDLDISFIKTMPSGRKPVKTHLTRHGSEKNVYDFVRTQLCKGRQAYFVYPLVERSDDPDSRTASLKDAQTMFDFLRTTIFPEYKTALIHSHVAETEQREIMQSFHSGETHILVATSVVEVGVDVPNATCMVIEHAERFGLAALHQLRGRVGRGQDESHCFLLYAPKLTEIAKERLKVLFENTDGFVIAERDLELRGPGEILGVHQSGYLSLAIAEPARDRAIMEIARKEAFACLQNAVADKTYAT